VAGFTAVDSGRRLTGDSRWGRVMWLTTAGGMTQMTFAEGTSHLCTAHMCSCREAVVYSLAHLRGHQSTTDPLLPMLPKYTRLLTTGWISMSVIRHHTSALPRSRGNRLLPKRCINVSEVKIRCWLESSPQQINNQLKSRITDYFEAGTTGVFEDKLTMPVCHWSNDSEW
jgi:hypothetical protein